MSVHRRQDLVRLVQEIFNHKNSMIFCRITCSLNTPGLSVTHNLKGVKKKAGQIRMRTTAYRL